MGVLLSSTLTVNMKAEDATTTVIMGQAFGTGLRNHMTSLENAPHYDRQN